jgi:GT2 family glycosyltransferase
MLRPGGHTANAGYRRHMDLSVVIPTYQRRISLARTLEALRRQTLERARFEVLVVDDDSSDRTWDLLQEASDVRAFRQTHNNGPAAARNVGIRNALGTWVLFLGDDTLPAPGCLEEHIRAHEAQSGEHIAVLGSVDWWEENRVTPLMRYLTTGGTIQHFAFHEIDDPENVPYGCFFTANVSVNRQFLLQNGMFDDEFRYAYGEDTELAYRLAAHGLRIIYRPEASVAHDHPTTYAAAKRRALNAGRTEILMARKHPELANIDFLQYGMKTRAMMRVRRSWTTLIVDPFLTFADRHVWDHPRLRKMFDTTLARHQLWSMMDARLAQTATASRARAASG